MQAQGVTWWEDLFHLTQRGRGLLSILVGEQVFVNSFLLNEGSEANATLLTTLCFQGGKRKYSGNCCSARAGDQLVLVSTI